MRPQCNPFEGYYDQPKQEAYSHKIGGGLTSSSEPKVGAGAF